MAISLTLPRSRQALFPGWKVVFAGFVGLAFGSPVLLLFTLGVFTGPLEHDLGWTRAQISLSATVFTAVSTVAFPFAGALLDRFGARRVVLVSLPLFAAAYASLGLTTRSLGAFYLAWAVITLLGSAPSNPAYCKAVASWFDRRLGLALGVTVAGQGIGAAAVPALAFVLLSKFGWRLAYAGLAGVALVATFAVNAAFLRNAPADLGLFPDGALQPPSGDGERAATAGFTFERAVRTRAFALLTAAFLLLGFMSTAILAHQVPMLVDAGFTPARAAAVQVVYGLALTAGRLVVGFSLDRFFAPRVLMASLGGIVVGLAFYARGVTGDAAFLCAALIGFGIGAEFDVLGYLVARYFGRRTYGKLYAVVLSVFTFGGGLGAAVFGAVRTRHGDYAPALWAVTATTCIAILLLSRLGAYPRSFEPAPSL